MKKFKLIIVLFFGVFATQLTAQSNSLESVVFEAKYQHNRVYHSKPILQTINGIIVANKGNIFDKIDPDDIEGFKVLKAEDGRNKYGDRAFVGVAEITLKKDSAAKYEKLLKEIKVKVKKDNFLKKSFKKHLYNTTIAGVIRGSESQFLPKVTITNITKKEVYYTDPAGNYNIKLAENDSIGFYAEGFEFHKTKVQNDTTLNINLKIRTTPIYIRGKSLTNAMLNMTKKSNSLVFN